MDGWLVKALSSTVGRANQQHQTTFTMDGLTTITF
jgi:hypothetical protein